MSITILSKSPQIIDANLGEDTVLFIAASSNFPPLTYEWYDVLNEAPIDNTNTPIYVLDINSAAGVFRVTVTDSNSDTYTSEDFIVNNRQLFVGGLSFADKVLPARINTTPGTANIADNIHVKGGYHQYDSIDSLIDASANYRRIQYGQYSFVEFDRNSFIGDTPQTRTSINKVYKCKIANPLLRYKQYEDESIRITNSDLNNAKNWSYDTVIDPNITQEAVLAPIFSNNTLTGVSITTPGAGYNRFKTFVGVYTTDDVDLSTATLRATVNLAGNITNITLVNGPISGFTNPPTIKVFGGTITKFTPTPIPPFLWTVGETYDANTDWVPVTFLNAEPDNITTKIVNGQLSAIGGGGVESTWTDLTPALNIFSPTYDMSRLVGHNAIQVLEDIIYPYQSVTIGLTAYDNNTPVDTLIENGKTVTITKVKAKINNYENLVDGTSVTLSGIYGVDTFTTEALGSKTKQQIIDASGLVEFTPSVINQPTVLNNTEGFSFTLSAVGREQGENYDGVTIPHYVYGSEIINWAHKIYYYKSPNSDISGNVSIPVGAGVTQPTLTASGVYEFPKTTNPEYAWIIVPESFTINEIGLPEENIPFYQYADVTGNKFVTTDIRITIGSNSYQYLGYRSYNKTASDVTVTIL